MRTKCIVCHAKLKPLLHDKNLLGVHGEGIFCTQTCAVFYARAVVPIASGSDHLTEQIERGLLCFPWIEKRRSKAI